MNQSDWEARRHTLSHRRLGNRFVGRVGEASTAAREGAPADRAVLSEFFGGRNGNGVSDALTEWWRLSDEAHELVESFEREMSPGALFRQPPLVNTDAATKKWLVPLSISVWRKRHSIDRIENEVSSALTAADKAAHALERVIAEDWNRQVGKPKSALARGLGTFARAVEALSRAFGRYPHRILVP